MLDMRKPGLTARLALILCALVITTTTSSAATGPQLYAPCAACHGTRGEGDPGVGAPAIAGQFESYIRRQLVNFRSGARGTHKMDVYGAQMRAASMAVLRDDRDAVALAKYVASLPRTTVKPAAKFDARNGNNLYQGKCGACHGGRAEGNESLAAPRLAGLDAVYIERQLRNFREGVRGAHPADKQGRQMAMMAPLLASKREIDDVVAHIHAAGSAR
jgi:cytochrome c553